MSTKTADITTAKTFFNSILSTPNAKFMTINLKDFYLGTLMTWYKYIHVPIKLLSQWIIDMYQLAPLIHNDFVYAEIWWGMYGLPQVGHIAYDQLVAILKPHEYVPSTTIPDLW